MDRNFYDNNFEEFLQHKSDQYKMYPSDRVWDNVYSSLHGRKKWWAIGFSLLFIGAGLAGRQFIVSDLNQMTSQLNKPTPVTPVADLTENGTPPNTNWPFMRVVPENSNTGNNKLGEAGQPSTGAVNTTPFNNSRRSQLSMVTGSQKETAQAVPLYSIENGGIIGNNNNIDTDIPSAQTHAAASNKTVPVIGTPSLSIEENGLTTTAGKTAPAQSAINQVENAAADPVKSFSSRWSVQLHASPSISYRRLFNEDQQNSNHIPVSTAYANDINQYVRHRPAPGFEIGSNVQYKLSNNLTVFAGAQLNYSRYYIAAFRYRTEKASITLDKAFVKDTLSGYTDIRNFSGYAPEQLQNKYLQVSIPVGAEIKLLGHKKLQFSVAGSLQPTFLLTSTSYLLSSDYKNYIQSPDLARTFNVHTNFEAIISYQSGGLKWQVGPQFRSQLLSSYSNQYQVREYLTEYGLKIGVTKTFR
jgi:hypothetical protein